MSVANDASDRTTFGQRSVASRLGRLLTDCVNGEHRTPLSQLCYPFFERTRPRQLAAAAQAGAPDANAALVALHAELLATASHDPAAKRVAVTVPSLPADHRARSVPALADLTAHFVASGLFDAGHELILHGSLASQDWCAYSDMDLVLVVAPSAFADASTLRRVLRTAHAGLRHVFAFDPLQHHGYMAIARASFANYDRAAFPPELLELGYTLSGRPLTAQCHIAPDPAAALADLDWLEHKLAGLATAHAAPRRAYDTKAALSVILSAPSIYFSAIGSPCFKRDSFAAIRGVLSTESCAILDLASELRHAWQPPEFATFRRLVRRSHNPTLWWRARARLLGGEELGAARALAPRRVRQAALGMARELRAAAHHGRALSRQLAESGARC